MLLMDDTAARQIWALNPKSLLKWPSAQAWYISCTNSLAFCQACMSSNRVIAAISHSGCHFDSGPRTPDLFIRLRTPDRGLRTVLDSGLPYAFTAIASTSMSRPGNAKADTTTA